MQICSWAPPSLPLAQLTWVLGVLVGRVPEGVWGLRAFWKLGCLAALAPPATGDLGSGVR